jgi:hypothetical protein
MAQPRVAVDHARAVYVTGATSSSSFPTTAGAFQPVAGGEVDGFVAKLSFDGSELVYSSFLGGSASDTAAAIAVNTAGSAYVTGSTQSSDFPTTAGAVQPVAASVDAFVARINPTGDALIYSTCLGGTRGEFANAIAVDAAGNAYVTGSTTSGDFPTVNAFQPPPVTAGFGFVDAFVTKLNANGSALLYSTYLGGSSVDEGRGIAVDADGNAYVFGRTLSPDFPTARAFQRTFGGGDDAFVTKFDATGLNLVYSSYLGGNDREFCCSTGGIALDTLPTPNAYVVSDTTSIDFPTTLAGLFTIKEPGADAFVAAISESSASSAAPTSTRTEPATLTGGGTIDVNGGIANFHLTVRRRGDGAISGEMQYINHVTGAKIRSTKITSLVVTGKTATLEGACTDGGLPCTFAVQVADGGESGTTDTFSISVTARATEGGTLRTGNIQVD